MFQIGKVRKDRSIRELMKRIFVRSYRYKYVREVLSRATKIPEGYWVFIVGCYNSGTTLLKNILGTHPEVTSLPEEGVYLTGELNKPKDFGWDRMWYMCQDRCSVSEQGIKPDSQKVKKEWGFWYDTDKSIFLEKSIVNSNRVVWLSENFSPAYFLWIVRNGYAVSEGIRRKGSPSGNIAQMYPNGYQINMCAKQWVINNRVIRKSLRECSNTKKLYYEDLVSDTQSKISEILSFLPTTQRTNKMNLKRIMVHGQKSNIENRNNASFDRLTKSDIDEINSVADKSLLRHNYDLI